MADKWIVETTPTGQLRIDLDRWTEEERALIRAGKCPWQTGYGLPWMTYCEKPGTPFCPKHDAAEKEAFDQHGGVPAHQRVTDHPTDSTTDQGLH